MSLSCRVTQAVRGLASKVINPAWTVSNHPAVACGLVIRIQKSLAISHVRSATHPLPRVVLTVSNSEVRLLRQSCCPTERDTARNVFRAISKSWSAAVVDLVQEFLGGRARLFVLRQVVWVGGHGEDLFELSAGVVVAADFLVGFGEV